MTTPTLAVPSFYAVEAVELYSEEFDYSVPPPGELPPLPLPGLSDVLMQVGRRALAAVAAIAFSGVLTIPPGGNLPSAVSEPAAHRAGGAAAPGEAMTAMMRAYASSHGDNFDQLVAAAGRFTEGATVSDARLTEDDIHLLVDDDDTSRG